MERIKRVSVLLWAAVLFFTGCGIGNDTNNTDVEGVPKEVEQMDFSKEKQNVIYLAGGCFWGLEHLMQSIPGVIDAQSG